MRWIARISIFTTALTVGLFAAFLFAANETPIVSVAVPAVELDPAWSCKHKTPEAETWITAESLRGTWKGTWDHNNGDCTLVIDRVNGNAFYGTLRKEGAEVLFEGTFDPKTRMLSVNETKVINLGPRFSVWSLGKNFGYISPDGQTMTGSGNDKWGQYAWAVSR